MKTFPREMHTGRDRDQNKRPRGPAAGEAPNLKTERGLRVCNVSEARRECF